MNKIYNNIAKMTQGDYRAMIVSDAGDEAFRLSGDKKLQELVDEYQHAVIKLHEYCQQKLREAMN